MQEPSPVLARLLELVRSRSMPQFDADETAGLPHVKGDLTNTAFHKKNVMKDSDCSSPLQVDIRRLTNVRWEDNTIVHHDLGKAADDSCLNDCASSPVAAIAFNVGSSGVTGGGGIEAGDIYWVRNLRP